MTSSPTVLVTGAAGFIGKHLCARLSERGQRVRALVRTPASGPWDESVVCALGADGLPAGALDGVDCVYHLAGRAHAVSENRDDADAYWRVNVEGTRCLLEAAEAGGVRAFVFFSSVKAMGEGGDVRMDESCSTAPESVYGRTKREAERCVAGARMHTVVLRLPLVYGCGVKGNLARMLDAVSRGMFPPLADCGNRRSLADVADVVEAALLVAGAPDAAGRTYIVTDGHTYSSREIFELMCAALGREVPSWSLPPGVLSALATLGDVAARVLGRRVGFDSEALAKLTGSAWYSSERLQRDLGFEPRGHLARALPGMVQSVGTPPARGAR